MALTEENRRQKHSHGEQTTVSIDRISELPDSVLCHILSFLQTKFSIRTSILARRWRYLWSYVPNLDFQYENRDIINSVMLLRKVHNVITLRILHHTECTDYQLQAWVSFAIARNVQKLDLLFFHSQIDLPRCLFTCKTLVYLRLTSPTVIPVCSAMCLPSLKKLYLLCVQFEADESLPHLLSGCPVLEELKLGLDKDMVYCNVSSPTIKRLVLTFTSDKLEINTPALEYLRISDSFSDHIKCGVLTSLIEANINLDENTPDSFLYSRSLLEFIDRFCNVKCLNLVLSHCPKIIDSVVYAWTTNFRNLTKLQLTADGRFLSKFLEKADNLEILTFSEFRGEIEDWMEPQQVPKCLSSHLRIVKLVNIKGKKHEFGYIKYLLRNAKVLKTMEISYPQSLASEEKIHLLHEISRFQRGSSACEVVFVGNVK